MPILRGTEFRRAALELKIAQAVEKLQAAGDALEAVDAALAVLTRNTAEDETAYCRHHSISQTKPALLYTASQRVVRALEGVSSTLGRGDVFSIEIRDSEGNVERVEMREGLFEVAKC